MIEILAAMSASAAAGIRVALSLLAIGLFEGESFWLKVPILSHLSVGILTALLTSLSAIELFASKQLLGQRFLQVFELLFCPIAGAIMGLAVSPVGVFPRWFIALIGGAFALVLQLVQVGWFYRLGSIPLWAVFLQDVLCVVLVFCAVNAPWQGGLIALFLLLFAARIAKQWYDWYKAGKKIER